MKVLVLGATGALGYNIVDEALRAGHDVRAMVRNRNKMRFDDRVDVQQGDAGDTEAVSQALDGREVLFYCINVPITEWTTLHPKLLDVSLQACKEQGTKLVFPANVWVYGDGTPGQRVAESRPLSPTSRKGALRQQLETMIASSGARYAVVRLPEFYGPNVANRLMGAPFQAALAGRTLTWYGTQLDVRCEYVFMPDGARAMVAVGTAEDTDGETFHLPGAAETSPRELFETIATAAGIRPRVRTLPRFLLRMASLFDGSAGELVDILHLWTHPILLDGSKYEERFGSLPRTSYEEGVGQTLAWFRAHPDAANAN